MNVLDGFIVGLLEYPNYDLQLEGCYHLSLPIILAELTPISRSNIGSKPLVILTSYLTAFFYTIPSLID